MVHADLGGADAGAEEMKKGREKLQVSKRVLKRKGLKTSGGDEGGFAPDLRSNEEAIEVILEAVEKTGYKIGDQVYLALDVAASEIFDSASQRYSLASEGKELSSEGMIQYYVDLVNKYPISSIEDGLSEDDWEGWSNMYTHLGEKIQIVGDDLTVTNVERLQKAIDLKAMNAILIKLNQVGTMTETIQTIELAEKNGLASVISHRSGETEDTTIADFCVAMGTGQIKTGSASRTDRICKYNQLLRIEEMLGKNARFAGKGVLIK